MTQIFPAYKLTCNDIDRLKVVAARIFDRQVSPQTRLEIIARSAGYGTYASMLAALDEHPILLSCNQDAEEAFIAQSKLDLATIPYIRGVGLNSIIAAALAWGERGDVAAAMMMSPEGRLKSLKGDEGRLTDYISFIEEIIDLGLCNRRCVFRSSLTFYNMRNLDKLISYSRIPNDDAVVLVSPENQRDLTVDSETKEPARTEVGPWMGFRVRLCKNTRFFNIPDDLFEVEWGSASALKKRFKGARIICFDADDIKSATEKLMKAGQFAATQGMEEIKSGALEVEGEHEGGFFSLGYYGTARNERDSSVLTKSPNELAEFALGWMAEIVNVVKGSEYEFARLSVQNPTFREVTRNERDLIVYF